MAQRRYADIYRPFESPAQATISEFMGRAAVARMLTTRVKTFRRIIRPPKKQKLYVPLSLQNIIDLDYHNAPSETSFIVSAHRLTKITLLTLIAAP